MKIKRNNKSMTIDVSNGKLQKKFATGGHLYKFGTEDFSLKPTSSNINLSEGTQPTTTTTPNGLHYSNAIDLSVATKGNNSTTPNGLPNGAGSMDLGKGKGTTPSTPSKKISTSDAVSGVSGIIQAGVEGYGKNSQIADTSTQRTEANDLKNKVLQDNSFQSLNNDISNTSLMNNLSFSDVRGLSGGQMGMNVLHSTLDGASSGASMGPIGAAAGAMVGLAGSAIGISVGNSKAFREQKRINNLINNANSSFLNNTSNQVYNIQNQTMANQGRNYFAQGGHLFEDGGKNDKYIDSNERYLMDYAQSKAYRNRLSKYTSDPNILNYAPNAAANELKSNFSSFVFPNANNFDNAGETYTVNKNKFYTGYDKLPQYLKGVIDDRWNSQPKDVRYALENHDRVVSVPTLTYSNDFYDMMGVRHPDMFKPLHHETGHFLDPFLNNQYPEEYKLYLTPDVEMFKSNLNKEHDSKISENYADLMELRAKLHEANVFDSSDPNAVFDLKNLNEFRKYLKKQKQGSNFLNNHNDGQIINAINKIAYNDNGNNGNQNVFANGGHLFSTGGKYNTWWNPNDFNFALNLKPSTAQSDKVDNMLINYLDSHYKQLSKLVRDNNMSSVGLGKYVISKLGLSRRFLIGAINACAWRVFQDPDDVSYKPSKNVTMTPVKKSGSEDYIVDDLAPNASYYIAQTLPGSNIRFIQYVVKPKPLVIKSEPELVEPHQLTEPSKKVLDRTTQQWVDVPASWNYGDPYPQGMIHPVGLATSPQPDSTVKWKPTPNKVDDNSGIRFDTVNQEYFDKNNKIVGRDINNNTETLVSKPTTPKYQFKSYQDVLNNKPDELANKFAEGGHIFKNGGTGLPSYPYLSVPQRQWSYSTPHVDYAGRISSFNPYNTGLVDPETGAYQLKPVVIKAKPEPMAARISANAKEEKKAAEQARLEAEEVARVKKNHPMADSDYDKSSIFNQPTQHPYLYSIAHEGGYSPSQTWQSAKEGMAAALAAPAAIAGAGAIGAAGGIGNVLNAPTIIGGRIASAAGLPAYYGSTAVDAAFAAHGANTLKDLAVKKYNGQSLDANDYANAALAGLEMAPAAPAIVNGMKMIKVPRYLSTDPEYALAAQTPSGQTMYIKPNEYRMLDEAKPGNEAPPEGDGTLASTLKKVKGKTSGLFKREKDPDDDMLRPESSMLGHYLKKTAGGLANAYGKLTDFTPTRLPYINAKRVINTNMNTYLDNDRYYLKEIQNNEPVDLSNASLFDKMTYEDAQKMYNAGVRWDDTKGTYDIAKTASDASEQSATPEVSPDVAKKYADLLNHRFDFSLKQVSSGDSKSNFMEGFKPGVGKAGQWNPQKKYANPNDDYESFMRSYLPGYRKFISIEDPYTQKPLLSAGKVMLSDHPIDQFMWKHPYLTRLPIGLVAGTAVNGLNNRITNGGWFNTDPNQFETPGVFADKSNASNRVRQITELASVLGPNWIRGIGYPLIAATGIYDKVAPTPFSINQPSIYKTFDNWNVRHNEDQSYPEKNYFQYLDSAKAHNFQEPYPLILLNDSTPMVNKQIIDQDEEMNAYKYTGRDSTAQDTLNQ